MVVDSDDVCVKISARIYRVEEYLFSTDMWQTKLKSSAAVNVRRQSFKRHINDCSLCSSCVAFFLIFSSSALPSIVLLLHLFNLYPSLPLLPSPLLPHGGRSDVNSAPQPSLAATTAHSASAMLLLRHTPSCQQQVLWVTTLRNVRISQTNGAFFGS